MQNDRRATLKINMETHEKLKDLARLEGVTISQLVDDALKCRIESSAIASTDLDKIRCLRNLVKSAREQ